MKVYDVLTGESSELPRKKVDFLRDRGFHSRNLEQTFNQMLVGKSKSSLNRFCLESNKKDVVFKMYNWSSKKEIECVNFIGFLDVVGFKGDRKKMFPLLNNLKSNQRKSVIIDGIIYCKPENKDSLNNHTFGCLKGQYKDKEELLKNAKIQRRISNALRDRIRHVIKHNRKSAETFSLTGCDISFFLGWIEAKFTKGMSWDNYGEWHIDHIRPCISFDLSKPEQQRECFHYSNMQPLWAIDNLKKGTKGP